MGELKPCPFCGSDCEFQPYSSYESNGYRVRCLGAGHALDWWCDTKKDAADIWNRRAGERKEEK